jgi:preprotein translocase subunit YajC
MKKSIVFVLVISLLSASSLLGSAISHAQEAPGASAPTVVAPAQPASAVPSSNSGAPSGAGQGAAVVAPAAQQPGLMGMALPFLIMLGIMYFLMIRPQQKRMKEHQTLLSSLKTGDEVITSAGILGTIAGMSEKVVTLEVSKNVQLKVLKSQVNQVVKGQIKDLQPNA